jgi:sugar/nucleoside kinase (ribokinase family)
VTTLDLFSIGSWTLFDHLLRARSMPQEGETVPLDMPDAEPNATHFGDCSANIAAAAGALGLRAGLGMVVGDDFVSSGYRLHLTELGVDLAGVEVRAGARSGHSYNVFDAANHGFCLSHLGLAAVQDDWRSPLDEIAKARALVVSEMFSPYTLAAIEHARALGRLTAINGMIASAGALTERFLRSADVLFLSRGEARDLEAALGAVATAELLAHGPRLVVVTRGSEGSLWHSADGTTAIPAAEAARFVDSTGAGDAFVAGAVFGMLSGFDAMQTGRCAAVVASFVVEAWGCQTNLPRLPDLRRRYREQFGEVLPG